MYVYHTERKRYAYTCILWGVPYKKEGVLVVPFKGLKAQFWYLLECLASKGPQRELSVHSTWYGADTHMGPYDRSYLTINLTSRRYSKQSCLSLLRRL